MSVRSSKLNRTYKVKKCVGILTTPDTKIKKYVEWLKMKNINVVIIPHDTTEHETYFRMINGLLIPGTRRGINKFDTTIMDCISTFLLLSLNDYFPIWGTCFGFQALICLIGGVKKLKKYKLVGLHPIHAKKSRIFPRNMGLDTHHNHDYGISVEDFTNNSHLRRFFTICATTDKEYVGAIEAKHYPIYGTAWHPELHDPNEHFSSFFISELKKNKH